MFVRNVGLRAAQVAAFLLRTRTPAPLIADLLRLRRREYVAATRGGQRLLIRPGTGERFAFYENLIRRDYLRNGATLRPGDTVVDIGANIGSFTVLAAHLVGAAGRVVALEPEPATFAQLQKNITLNRLDNVSAVNAAVGGHAGTVELHVSPTSLFTSTLAGGHMGDTVKVTVPCVTLETLISDHRLDRIDLLKVDCEGAEHEIFAAMTPALAARLQQIAMEVHDMPGWPGSQLSATLRALGFIVHEGYPLYAHHPAGHAGSQRDGAADTSMTR